MCTGGAKQPRQAATTTLSIQPDTGLRYATSKLPHTKQARQAAPLPTTPHLSRKKSSSSRSSKRCSDGLRCAYTLRLYTTAAFRLAISRSAATSSKKVGRSPSPPSDTNDMADWARRRQGRRHSCRQALCALCAAGSRNQYCVISPSTSAERARAARAAGKRAYAALSAAAKGRRQLCTRCRYSGQYRKRCRGAQSVHAAARRQRGSASASGLSRPSLLCCCPGCAAETWIAAGSLQASADAPVAPVTAPGLLGWPCGILRCFRTSMRAVGLCQQGARPAGLLAATRPAPRRLASVAAATTLQPLGGAPRSSSGRRGLTVTAAARQESAATAGFAAEINAACNAALQLMLAGEAGRAAEEQQRLRGLQQTALAAGDEQVRPRLRHCARAWGVGCSAHRCTSAGSSVHVPTALSLFSSSCTTTTTPAIYGVSIFTMSTHRNAGGPPAARAGGHAAPQRAARGRGAAGPARHGAQPHCQPGVLESWLPLAAPPTIWEWCIAGWHGHALAHQLPTLLLALQSGCSRLPSACQAAQAHLSAS